MAEVSLFADSTASRLIQMADLLAWAVWRRYEYHDTRYFDLIVRRFDREGGVLHGLVHHKDPRDECHCPGCLSRALAGVDARRTVRDLPLRDHLADGREADHGASTRHSAG